MATIAQAANHLFLEERRFRELVDAGAISRAARGSYDLNQVREQYIRNLREVAAGRVKSGDLDPQQEKARKDKEYADHLAMRNDITRGEVVLVEDVGRLVDGEYAAVRNNFVGLPGKMAPRCAMQPQEVIHTLLTDEVDEILRNLSDPDEIAGKATRR